MKVCEDVKSVPDCLTMFTWSIFVNSAVNLHIKDLNYFPFKM